MNLANHGASWAAPNSTSAAQNNHKSRVASCVTAYNSQAANNIRAAPSNNPFGKPVTRT